jgi:hypothetical protein
VVLLILSPEKIKTRMKNRILLLLSIVLIFTSCKKEEPKEKITCAEPGTASAGEIRWCDQKSTVDTITWERNAAWGHIQIQVEGTMYGNKFFYIIFLPDTAMPTTTRVYTLIQQTIMLPSDKAYLGATLYHEPTNPDKSGIYRCLKTGAGQLHLEVNGNQKTIYFTNAKLEENMYNNIRRTTSARFTFK